MINIIPQFIVFILYEISRSDNSCLHFHIQFDILEREGEREGARGGEGEGERER